MRVLRLIEALIKSVARGEARPQDLASEHIRRLALLELIHESDGKLALTELGRVRLAPSKPEKWIADEVTLKRP